MGSFHITVGKVYLFTYYDDAVYGRYCPWDNNNYGNRNAKIAKAKLNIEGKKVWSLYNNIKIYYNSIKGAARQTGLNSANIRSAIKRKGKCGIYYWGYANND